MNHLLEVRSMIIQYYKRFETIIIGVCKFLLMFFVFTQLNSFFPGGLLDRPLLNVMLALLCVILSPHWIVLLMILVFSGQAVLVSLEGALVMFAGMAAMYLLFVRMFPKLSIFVILVPVCFKLNIPLVVPLMLGLFFSIDSIIPMILGIVTYFGIPLGKTLINISGSEDLFSIPTVVITNLENMIKYFTGNIEMLAIIVVFVGALLLTYILRRLSVDFAHYIAILASGFMYIIFMILAIIFMKLDLSPVLVIIQGVLSMVVAVVMQYMHMVLDYPRSESVQFEDDEYYYYVKAVPKVNKDFAPTIKHSDKSISKSH